MSSTPRHDSRATILESALVRLAHTCASTLECWDAALTFPSWALFKGPCNPRMDVKRTLCEALFLELKSSTEQAAVDVDEALMRAQDLAQTQTLETPKTEDENEYEHLQARVRELAMLARVAQRLPPPSEWILDESGVGDFLTQHFITPLYPSTHDAQAAPNAQQSTTTPAYDDGLAVMLLLEEARVAKFQLPSIVNACVLRALEASLRVVLWLCHRHAHAQCQWLSYRGDWRFGVLHAATIEGNARMVSALLQSRAFLTFDLSAHDPENPVNRMTALGLACKHRHRQAVVSLLLAQPPSKNLRLDAQPFLLVAATPVCDPVESAADLVRSLVSEPASRGLWLNARSEKGNTALINFCLQNDVQAVRVLLELPFERELNVNSTNNTGFTALMASVKHEDAAAFKLLLSDPRVNVNLRNSSGESALALSVRMGNASAVRSLLDLPPTRGLRDQPNANGFSAIGLCVSRGYVDILDMFVQHVQAHDNSGVAPAEKDLEELFYTAVKHKQPLALHKLLGLPRRQHDADASKPLDRALREACRTGQEDSVRLLVEQTTHELDVNAREPEGPRHTALMLACLGSHARCVELLLSARFRGLQIDVNAPSACGKTPLIAACAVGDCKTVAALCAREDTDVVARDARGYTALFHVFPIKVPANGQSAECFSTVLRAYAARGLSVRAAHTGTPSTLLMHACALDCPQGVELLIQKLSLDDLELNARNAENRTAFSMVRSSEVLKLFASLPASYSLDLDGLLLVDVVCAVGADNSWIAHAFLSRGADVLAKTCEGRTALMVASGLGRADLVRALLKLPACRALVNHRDVHGLTALSLAVRAGHARVVHALLDADKAYGLALDTCPPVNLDALYPLDVCTDTLQPQRAAYLLMFITKSGSVRFLTKRSSPSQQTIGKVFADAGSPVAAVGAVVIVPGEVFEDASKELHKAWHSCANAERERRVLDTFTALQAEDVLRGRRRRIEWKEPTPARIAKWVVGATDAVDTAVTLSR